MNIYGVWSIQPSVETVEVKYEIYCTNLLGPSYIEDHPPTTLMHGSSGPDRPIIDRNSQSINSLNGIKGGFDPALRISMHALKPLEWAVYILTS